MNIGIVTVWFERGAAYVSRIYYDALKSFKHNVYIYERGEKCFKKHDKYWTGSYVTKEKKYSDGNITQKQFIKWIKKYKLDCVFFNEQHNFRIVAKIKKRFPKLLIGSYVDYYKEKTIPYFNLFDFVICNTHKHYETMSDHPQKYYIKWGSEIDKFKPGKTKHKEITFFHSVGMSYRKGTEILIKSFIDGKLYTNSNLLIHTQIPIENFTNLTIKEMSKFNIKVIEKTITKPGLYHLGDVYVYPTRLDGLGLTMYEALSCGLPVIATDYSPMNEIINNSCGQLVKVQSMYCRNDGYYYPMCICDKLDLINKMKYYIDNIDRLDSLKFNIRNYACKNLNIKDRYLEINNAFTLSKIRKLDINLYKQVLLDFQNPIIKAIKVYSDSHKYLSKLKAILRFLIRRK